MTETVKLRAGERIQFLIERDGKVCRLPSCKNPTAFSHNNPPTTDHWIPVSKGGEDIPSNWVLMHMRCNSLKADRLVMEDGTLEPIERTLKPAKVQKRPPCEECMEGRLLLQDEICPYCGSEPQPKVAPRWAQKTPKECSHSGSDHCWMCFLGFVNRTPASSDVFGID